MAIQDLNSVLIEGQMVGFSTIKGGKEGLFSVVNKRTNEDGTKSKDLFKILLGDQAQVDRVKEYWEKAENPHARIVGHLKYSNREVCVFALHIELRPDVRR